ncbi:hypothetical protein CEXT_361341 [Caerostris extrusa]|uniref:Uncharacterized protein n=1 Tax=Caerostris extrusa TaxID=172846 RepID=A0AAV4T150_CAEEX|nr:hypothetical protein CEXT_361341 [Caerostris extrusa]
MDTDQPNGFFEMIPARSWWGSKDFISSAGEEGNELIWNLFRFLVGFKRLHKFYWKGRKGEGGVDLESFPFCKDVFAYHLMEEGFCFGGLQKTFISFMEGKERGEEEGGVDLESFPFCKDVYAYHLMEDGFCCNFYYRGQDE